VPLYRDARELDFELSELPRLPEPCVAVLADPEHFDVVDALNPHMLDERGELKRADRTKAREEWDALRAAIEDCDLRVIVLEAVAGQPDFVFCANTALPIPGAALPDGRARAVPSRMSHPSRRGEVEPMVRALERLGVLVEPLSGPAERFEGTGDGLWHPGRRLLWAGVGPRTCDQAWEEIAAHYDLPLVRLGLVNPAFYHLDTCFALLAEDACLWHPPALEPAARELVEALVPRRIEADPREAREGLACNALPIGGRVLLPAGCSRTRAHLEREGFEVREVDTAEFQKSGGSAFCMKLLLDVGVARPAQGFGS
jgi:N-dimethylarginine dimethylaminohydrolase